MVVTDAGIVTLSNEVQPAKAFLQMDLRSSGSTRSLTSSPSIANWRA